MIDFYFFPTPNGRKVAIFFEEAGLAHNTIRLDITKGEQFKPEFLAVNPNGKMPAIVDHDANGGPLAVFESAAILSYLAEKTGRFGPKDARHRAVVNEWLFWQMAGLGPMLGQANHFVKYAKEQVPYAIKRYTDEAARLAGVLDRRLAEVKYVAGADYSIVDMCVYPWALVFQDLQITTGPSLTRWLEEVGARPAVQRAYAPAR